MTHFDELTIVSSCSGYSKYLAEWVDSIRHQTVRPNSVILLTHGSATDEMVGRSVIGKLNSPEIYATHVHYESLLDFGVARNLAVSMATTEWVMHLDCDDALLPHAVADFMAIAPTADVISAGYRRTGQMAHGPSRTERVYHPADGLKALDLNSMASGVSPFRKSFWEKSPYREDMLGAWDTALWIGFARLGARFRPTKRAVFNYRQHADSIFNKRRKLLNWTRHRTTAQLKSLRRNDHGVAVIVPRDKKPSDRVPVWNRVKAHYETHHPDWDIVEGFSMGPFWCKGEAVADALNRTNADILVLADADCIVDPEALRKSVDAVASGATWAVPHLMVYRATQEMTAQYLAADPRVAPVVPDRHSVHRDVYEGFLGGGLVVTRRVWYEAIGGIPRAFRGWGHEDQALACACLALLGSCVRGDADLLHLYHEPQTPHRESSSNLQLLRRLGHAAQQGKDALVAMLATLSSLPTTAQDRRGQAMTDRQVRQSFLFRKHRRAP